MSANGLQHVTGRCSDDCYPLCDFCVFMEPIPLLPDGNPDFSHKYYGRGPCHNRLSPEFGKVMDWIDDCDFYVCKLAVKKGWPINGVSS